MECGAEGSRELVVASRHAAELFELVEKAFDAIALAIERLVVVEFLAAGVDRRNDRLDPIHGEPLTDPVGIVAFVEGGGFQDVVRIQTLIEAFEIAAVVGLARSQVQRHAAVLINGRGVNFGGQSAARAPQSLLRTGFFGAPAAW